MSLLPSAMKDSDPIPTGLGKKIEPIPKPEVQHGTEVAPGVFDVGGKLETRIEKNEEANQPTTLEQAWSFMHGLGEAWFHHQPGDPMPCDGDQLVRYRMRGDFLDFESRAGSLDWGVCAWFDAAAIVAWRPAC